MKKLLVLLLALTFVSAFVSAQDAAPVPEVKLVATIEGDANFQFGINLDDPTATGLSNANSSNIKLQLVTKATTEKGGKEGEEVYGWIKLKDFEIKTEKSVLTGAIPGIEAKLFLGPVYINILGDAHDTAKTTDTLDVGITQTDGGDATWDFLGMGIKATGAQDNIAKPEFAGIIIGLKDTSVVDVKLGVQSLADWKVGTAASSKNEVIVASGPDTSGDATVTYTDVNGNPVAAAALVAGRAYVKTTATAADPINTKNAYDLWLSVDLNVVPGLIVGVKGAVSLNSADTYTYYGLGAKVGYKIALADNINLTPEVGFDYRGDTKDATADSAWRFEGGVGLTLPGSKLDDWDKFGSKKDLLPGLSVLYAIGAVGSGSAGHDLQVALFDGDLIPVVNLVAVAQVYDLTNTAGGPWMGIGAFASADFNQIVPWAYFTYFNKIPSKDKTLLDVGFDLKVITNTTFTLEYKSGDLSGNTAGSKLGTIVFTTKIAY